MIDEERDPFEPAVKFSAPVSEYTTKRQLIGAGLIAGVAQALTIGAVIAIAIMINDFQQTEIGDNKDRLDHQAAIIRRQEKLIAGLNALTHPTHAQYRRQLREGIRRCLREPSCRRLFPKLGRASRALHAGSQRSTSPSPSLDRSPGSTSTPLRRPQSGGRSPSRPRPRPEPRPSRTPASPPNQPPSSGGPQPRPTVDLHAPVPVQVCAGKALGINC